jgi:hypothetical protein
MSLLATAGDSDVLRLAALGGCPPPLIARRSLFADKSPLLAEIASHAPLPTNYLVVTSAVK